MLGITAVAVIIGIVLVQTATTEAEEDFHSKVSQLETQFTVFTKRLLEENEKLTKRLQHQEMLTERSKQEEQKHRQQEEENVSVLQQKVELLKGQLENVTNMQLERKSGNFKDVIDEFKLHGAHNMLAPNRRKSRSTDPDEVAFTAELSHELNNVPIHTTIKFDFPIHWTGDHYDSSTGVFTCPTSGLYLFAVFIESDSVGIEAAVKLMMDGKGYMFVVSETSVDGEDDTGGNVILLPVNKGQRVWVETYQNDNQSFWKSFTTFSGVLIYRH